MGWQALRMRFTPASSRMPTTAAQDPLAALLEALTTHPSPARMMPVLGGLMVILLREMTLIALDEEMAQTGGITPPPKSAAPCRGSGSPFW
jgi:hypothetical protein